jgi:hypothetical protein
LPAAKTIANDPFATEDSFHEWKRGDDRLPEWFSNWILPNSTAKERQREMKTDRGKKGMNRTR